ncbi:MAG: hypothetical protein HXX08_15575 [Chloroflexi bacterium]|uniref:Uncharacterized protein n=1 Tax=Candidatus Chlorohelix allophototropha TaxID=3003348 RepID=A0A8T7M5L5_9CHLR|nr:hypothetical protein [Chloroflexota bacterium]WJW69200.1 hypothetical protein OZ401_002796 [Chloroflexota bacterium L227-S17]
MENTIDEIQQAIEAGEIERARLLLRDALKQPDAKIYYLASKVALNENQRQSFLQKAIELDPQYAEGNQTLEQQVNPVAVAETPVQYQYGMQPENAMTVAQATVTPEYPINYNLSTSPQQVYNVIQPGYAIKKPKFPKILVIGALVLVVIGVLGIIIAVISASNSSSKNYGSSSSSSGYSRPTATPDPRVYISSYKCLTSGYAEQIGTYFEACADPSDFYPSVNGKINLYYRLISNTKPVSGTSVNFRFYSKLTSETCSSYTNSSGIATCSIPVGGKGMFLSSGETEAFTIVAKATYSGKDVGATAYATAYGQ